MLEIMEKAGESGNSPVFSIEFVTSDGRIRRIAKGLRGASRYTKSEGGDSRRKSANQKERNLINITDLERDEVKSVTIACIIRFNNELVHH